jgi:PAS domain S-box-containing protein
MKGLFALVMLLHLVAGVWIYRGQERLMRHEAEATLRAVAELKADQIGNWRRNLTTGGSLLSESPYLSEAVSRFLNQAPPESGESAAMLDRLGSLRDRYDCLDVQLVDAGGGVRLSLTGKTGSLHEEALRALHLAFGERRVTVGDLHAGSDGWPAHIDALAPFFERRGAPGAPVGAIVLIVDAQRSLFPLIQSWPIPSGSAETLLVRRDGDHVLFLTELRHRQGTALRLRIPVSRADLPAAMAVLGREGVVEGRDYRGTPVFAANRAIPDSSWFVVAKIDADEALAGWRARSALILALVVLLMLVSTVIFALVWLRDAKGHYKALYETEAARRKSEARYGATLMSVGDGVIAADAEGRIDLMNPVAETLTGWRLQEARGRPLEEVFVLLNEETRQPAENPVRRILREGRVIGLANHTLLVGRDGTERPIADSGAPIHAGRDKIDGVVLVFRDRSGERRAQETLHTLTMRRSALLSAVPDIVMEMDVDKNYTWANRAGYEFFGDDVVGRKISDFFVGEQHIDTVLEPLLAGDERVFHIESLQRGTAGRQRLLAWWCRVLKDADGGVTGALSSARDITESRQAENALRESELRYRRITETVTDYIYTVRVRDGLVTDTVHGPGCIAVTGYSEQEFAADPFLWHRMVHAEDRPLVVEQARLLAAGVDVPPFAHRIVRKDGALRWVSNTPVRELDEHGRLIGYDGLIQDVTERTRARAEKEKLQAQLLQAQKMEAIGQLAGGVAHDLNNLLTPILGYGELLLYEFDSDDRPRERIGEILKAAQRARDLVHQLLAFGRKQTLQLQTVNLNDVLTDFLKLLRRTIREDIRIETDLAAGIPAIHADVGQIEQVIMNLSVNAQDAMPGGGRIVIETAFVELDDAYRGEHPSVKPGPYVSLTIGDTGQGMDAETREQIFVPFFTTKPEGKGTGLGLATVYGVVKQHGGNIWVYSEPGQGTTFRVYLPAKASDSAVDLEPVRTPEPARGHETVMVVEDNDAVRKMAVEILKRQGYTVLSAASGSGCLRLLDDLRGPLHLLLTDVVMPEMDGKALYARVARRFPKTKVLYMSGHTGDVIAHRGVLDEGIEFVQKPFSIQALTARVREVLESG